MKKLLVFLLLIPFFVFAQSSWKRSETPTFSKVELFHSSKSANYPTTESLLQGNFVFEISHRFGSINGGYDNFYGLDDANIRFSLGYGITDGIMVTLGRSSVYANTDLAVKFKVLDLEDDKMPSAIALNVGLTVTNQNVNGTEIQTFNADYMQYFGQLVYNIAFFDKKLAVGIVPSFIYNSYVFAASYGQDKESTISLGVYSQYYFNRMWSIWFDYTTVVNGYKNAFYDDDTEVYDPISFGTAIETGGHIFHVFITNSHYLNPTQFLTGTEFNTESEAWRFGFGITRQL